MDNFNNEFNNSTEPTVDYSQPGTFTGETAQWQANNAQEELPTYTESFGNAYSYEAPAFETAPAQEPKKLIGLSIASMILGILSIVCCSAWYIAGLFALAGLVLGIISMVKKCSGKGMAIAGIICSVIGLIIAVVMLLIVVVGFIGSASSSSYYYY